MKNSVLLLISIFLIGIGSLFISFTYAKTEEVKEEAKMQIEMKYKTTEIPTTNITNVVENNLDNELEELYNKINDYYINQEMGNELIKEFVFDKEAKIIKVTLVTNDTLHQEKFIQEISDNENIVFD